MAKAKTKTIAEETSNLDNIFFVIDVDLYMCQFIISLNQNNAQLAKSFDCMSILVHELSHAVMFTFDRIGTPHNADTDEPYSYLLGYLMKKFFENIR